MECLDVIEAIKSRRSIRKYKKKKIPKNILTKIIDAGRWAPSSKNKQPWEFIIIDDKEKIEFISQSKGEKWIAEAPILIVAISNPEESPNYHMSDTAMAIQNISLAALKYGLGTCWIGIYEFNEIKERLGIPKNRVLVGALAIGYPDEKPKPRPRKPLEEIIHHNTYNTKHKENPTTPKKNEK